MMPGTGRGGGNRQRRSSAAPGQVRIGEGGAGRERAPFCPQRIGLLLEPGLLLRRVLYAAAGRAKMDNTKDPRKEYKIGQASMIGS